MLETDEGCGKKRAQQDESSREQGEGGADDNFPQAALMELVNAGQRPEGDGHLEEKDSRWKERVEAHLACLRNSSKIVWPELGELTHPLNEIIYTKCVAVPGT